jgi:hypothetical protein
MRPLVLLGLGILVIGALPLLGALSDSRWLVIGAWTAGGSLVPGLFCIALGASLPSQQRDDRRRGSRIGPGRRRARAQAGKRDLDLAPDQRRCPRCAEVIQRRAKVCRFCGADFDEARA